MQWPLTLNWRRGSDIPTDSLRWAASVVINEMVYCGGGEDNATVIQYNAEVDNWNKLPNPPVKDCAMTSLNGQLVLAGGDTNQITVWNSDTSEWVCRFRPMPTGRATPAAVGYEKYLIVACGRPYMSKVEVLDSCIGRWYTA